MSLNSNCPTEKFVETTTVKKIRKLLNGARRLAQFSYLFGPAGRGKTRTAKEWIALNGNAAYVRIRTDASPTRIRAQLSDAIFGDGKASHEDIIRHISAHPGFLLVIDEAAHLIGNSDARSGKNLDMLRDIYDEVNENGGRCGICMIFTDYSLTRLKKSRLGLFLKQFINRGDSHLEIKETISKSYEIARLLDAWMPGGYPPDMVDAAYTIAMDGGIRALEKRLAILLEMNVRAPEAAPVTGKNLLQLQAQFNDGWIEEDK